MPPPRQAGAAEILGHLDAVERERQHRAADPALGARVQALKAWQQARFRAGYADLLASPRYGAAAHFFLDELYGPRDFSRRDAQFARIVPAVVRLFPPEIVYTVATLGGLHALSESLDSAMGAALGAPEIDAAAYARAWQAVGRAADRERQIALTLDIGASLEGYARRPMLSASLRLMRGPAHAAGLSELQRFLESGFDAFKAMRGADEFLRSIGSRERAFVAAQFDAAA